MIDLGDVAVLTVTNTDSTGAPVDAGAMTLSVTQPDGTIASPSVSHTGTGTYTAAYVAAQVGRHLVRWVATGANPGAYVEVFNVSAADPGMLIGLAEARTALGNMPNAATAKDELLRSYVAAMTPIIEDIVGPILPRQCDETHDGGGPMVRLLYAPIIAVTTVTEAYGAGYVRTLSNQPLGGSSYDAFGYTVDLDDASLTRRVSGVAGIFAPGRRNVRVVYTAGRTTMRPNVLLAIRALLRHMWTSAEQGYRPPQAGPDTQTTTTPSGFVVPTAVIELCADDVRAIGMA